MPNLDDHGLEVIKKAGVDIEPSTPKRNYALQMVGASKFDIPADADAFTRSVVGNSEIINFRKGGKTGPILKTITVEYQTPPDPDLVSGEIS